MWAANGMSEREPEKEVLRRLLISVKSLQKAMADVSNSTSTYHIDNWVAYKQFAKKYSQLAILVNAEIELSPLIDVFDVDRMPGPNHLLPSKQKEIFETVIMELSLLRGQIETHIGVVDDEVRAFRDFLQSRLRSAVLKKPEHEVEVQNVIEQLLIGRGMSKGQDYDHEVGRVKISSKESVPDFILPLLSLALEIKLTKTNRRVAEVVDEVNADIASYCKKYEHLLFVVYDLGCIRDEMEFRRDLEGTYQVAVMVIKH